MTRAHRYTLKLADVKTVKMMGEPVYFITANDDGTLVEWTRGLRCATTFENRAAVDAFKAKHPHIGGRVVRAIA